MATRQGLMSFAIVGSISLLCTRYIATYQIQTCSILYKLLPCTLPDHEEGRFFALPKTHVSSMSGAPPQVAYSLAHTYPNQIISNYSLRTYNASVRNYHLLCQRVVYPILTFEPFNALSRYGYLSGLEKARTGHVMGCSG